MPSEHNPVLVEQPIPDHTSQSKLCTCCQLSLVDNTSSIYLHEADALVCTSCRERVPPARVGLLDSRIFCADPPSHISQPILHEGGDISQNTRQITKSPVLDDEMVVDAPAQASRPCHAAQITNPSYVKKHPSLTIHCNTSSNSISTAPQHTTYIQHSATSISPPRRQTQVAQYPHPLTDITRLRVRSHGSDCLYPGATFRGIQKSGRNNYDVDVTIVDVNFASSYLCGYLRIRGLTDDHPDLTTYFDAEIIGSRYGFLTRNWGATEQEDLVHWGRFPAFNDIKDELRRPHMKLADRDRGIVFMRWKERFLVPNHRVAEINGASFAGFYYICVEFNPRPPSTRSTSQQVPLTPEADVMSFAEAMSKSEAPRQPRRESITRHKGGRLPSLAARSSPPVAKMTGFYYHRNSEPYQQLTLYHDPRRVGASFELR
ncbi:putative vacuolar import and degradation protein [Lyophyllum shimeji]|uniref:Vacuolar import and degradation protein n=1 Tax=Lyophyllum shimeji TaxID=47721 RepID=A0A9P3PG45_LYOSH|nr:putative vacuolar import and degradation protein [Lyophyllum shimeji]